MKTISIANLKGGVGKTITTINLAYLLASEYDKHILIIDNDQQGNTSQFFGRYGYEHAGMSEVMQRKCKKPEEVIQHTENPNIDIIAANLSLAAAERQVQSEANGLPQQLRLKTILLQVRDRYDYCIIDNAPSIGMCVINALAASDFLIVPVKIDRFTFEGLDSLLEQAGQMREYFNKRLRLLGTLITSYRKNASNVSGEEWLKQAEQYRVFDHHIRYTDKIDESTFSQEPITVHSKTCGASRDYRAWTAEALAKMAAAEGGEDDE
mgnify:CR=1 FL=1